VPFADAKGTFDDRIIDVYNNGRLNNNMISDNNMEQMVTITKQGQLTIPKKVLKMFGIRGSTKAKIKVNNGKIVVEPKKDFWSLAGSLSTGIRLSDKQLKEARKAFEREWPRKM